MKIKAAALVMCAVFGGGVAQAQEPERWTGAWLAAGDTEWKYVDGVAPDVAMVAVFPELGQVRLRGRVTDGVMILEGEAEKRPKRVRGRGQPRVRLAARHSRSGDELDVSIQVNGEGFSRTRWHRPGPARLAFARERASYTPSERRPLVLEVFVIGRPQPVVIKVLCSDSRYAHLDGLVHYEETDVLPVGRHRIVWTGRDRSYERRVAKAGSYTLLVESADSPIGLPPPVRGGARPQPGPKAQLALHILRAKTTRAPAPTPKRTIDVRDADWPELTDSRAGWPMTGTPLGLDKKGLDTALPK